MTAEAHVAHCRMAKIIVIADAGAGVGAGVAGVDALVVGRCGR